jgi:hypothetical protein
MASGSLRDEDFVDCYSGNAGRPSIPPSRLAKLLLLQYRTGLSDEQTMEATAWDLGWKIALGLPVDHRGWNSSSLTRFRARLLLHGKERLALEATLSLAGEPGCSTPPPSRSSTRRRWAPPPLRTPSGSCARASGSCSSKSEPATRGPPGGSTMGLSSTTRNRLRSPTAAGAISESASGC